MEFIGLIKNIDNIQELQRQSDPMDKFLLVKEARSGAGMDLLLREKKVPQLKAVLEQLKNRRSKTIINRRKTMARIS